MKLIADSGSTKTAWCLLTDANEEIQLTTAGINPFQQTEADIVAVLHGELMPRLTAALCSSEAGVPSEIHFYGAGCTAEASPKVAAALHQVFGQQADADVQSDMLGAARALCGHTPGIVAILGTGSNSCRYDGRQIIANVSPLGFILGDEGSGAYIGKRLVGDVLKRQLPEAVCRLFLDETHETAASIIRHTYREPMPNRYLASLSPFCARHRDIPAIHDLLTDCFRQFFLRNIALLSAGEGVEQAGDRSSLLRKDQGDTLHFVGSIAYHYQSELLEVAASMGYTVGNILKAPIDGLVRYHS